MFRPVYLAFAFLLASASATQAGCRVVPYRFMPNQTVDAYMYVSNGSNCSTIIHAGGRSSFHAATPNGIHSTPTTAATSSTAGPISGAIQYSAAIR